MIHDKFVAPEIWGGLECTINRVEKRYMDQLDLTGYYQNPGYLDQIMSLGIKAMRFPVLWEKHQPSFNTTIDFNWANTHLNKLRQNNITPIVGLLHHGSGPSFTSLLQDDFPELFAAYAANVAAAFPWIENYTPINEPLTTARFSGLYGLWYPHKKNDVSFIKILLNELKGIVLAMKEIRKVNPLAKLVLTEDLAKTYSTPLLDYQAAFENQRRWLTYDILMGRFDYTHPLWNYFMRLGIEKSRMKFFLDNPCSPDLIGVNYYVTSERYLDEQLSLYPGERAGGNSLHHYVDVEAARIDLQEPHGLEVLLREIWERYKITLAITEVQLNCSREEQLRWFIDVHDTALKLKRESIDIRGVTAWAMLGSFGWDKLLTSFTGEYETGVFDISSGHARPTALASLIKNLILKKNYHNSLTDIPGWWKTNSRFFIKARRAESKFAGRSPQPVIIIGKSGTLGNAFSKICRQRNIPHFLMSRAEVDIGDASQVESMIARYHPWAIINAAGYVKIDEAENEKHLCWRENTLGPAILGRACEDANIKLVSFSSDQVFSGAKNIPYIESDFCAPVNYYGLSKQLAENVLNETNPSSLIIRSSAFFGPWDNFNFITNMLSQLYAGRHFIAANDITISPTYVPHLVQAALDLMIDDESGIWHLANRGAYSWFEFAKSAALRAGLDADLVTAGYDMQYIAKRPSYSVMASEKYMLMPTVENALQHFFDQLSPECKQAITVPCQ